MNNTAIKNIADLIIAEAKVENSDNSLAGSIGHVQHLVMMEVSRRLDEIRREEVAWRLKKEIIGE